MDKHAERRAARIVRAISGAVAAMAGGGPWG